MQQLDSKYYRFTCPVCRKNVEVCELVDVYELPTEVIPLCVQCATGLKQLRKACELPKYLSVISSILDRCAIAPGEVSKYNPGHFKVAAVLQPSRETFRTMCDCCGKLCSTRENQFANIPSKEALEYAFVLHTKRKRTQKIFKDLKFSVDLCDNCLDVVLLLASKAESDQHFCQLVNRTFTFSPFTVGEVV